jgi:ribonuclease HII
MKQADLLIPSVSAASIIAKVARDAFMEEQDAHYPGYGFSSHVGYGTKQHSDALKQLGVTPLHRKSFAPIADLLGATVAKVPKKPITGTSRDAGNKSEDIAAAYLEYQQYTVIERNWKTKMCEIDIVAEKDGVWYFVEVKHRKGDAQGGGLAAITKKKLKQMTLAARLYAHFQKADDADMRLMVVTTNGTPPVVESQLFLG